jgi:LmbE family N-acetylglucosaminyl deacetylase
VVSRPGDGEQRRAGHPRRYTEETAWRAWDGWATLPDLDLPAAGQLVSVVSAHPDDDVLAIGGLVQRLRRRGCDLAFVCATDGEASHPDSPTMTPTRLALHRTDELGRALARLGCSGARHTALHLPDGRLGDASAELANRLEPSLQDAAVVLAPWRGDGHPDHEACGRAAVTVSDRWQAGPAVWEYPVWAWHWAEPGSPAVPWGRARAVRLGTEERLGKAEAINEFRSQVEPLSDDPADAPVLPHAVLAHFTRAVEVVFT